MSSEDLQAYETGRDAALAQRRAEKEHARRLQSEAEANVQPVTPSPRTPRRGPHKGGRPKRPVERFGQAQYEAFMHRYDAMRECVGSLTYYLNNLPQHCQPQARGFAAELTRTFNDAVLSAKEGVEVQPDVK